jgi:hypothetical protein
MGRFGRLRTQLSDGAAAVVPEPSTSAMMILGFAGVGFTIVSKEEQDAAESRVGNPFIDSEGRLRAVFLLCAEYERQLGGGSPLSSLMAVKD